MQKRWLALALLALLALSSTAGAEELPLCAPLAGEYITRDREEPGVRELASYLYANTILTAEPYTDYSRTRLTLYSTTITSPVIAQGSHVFYYETLEQVEPYVFLDDRGSTVTFFVDENGDPTGFNLDGVAYEPMFFWRQPAFINLTIFVIQGLCVLGPAMLLCVLVAWRVNRRRRWRSFAATRMNTALCGALALVGLNTFGLLAFAVPDYAYAQYAPLLWLNAALMVCLVALPVGMVVTWRRSELVARQKLCYAGSIAAAVVTLALMLAWQLYQ